MIALADRVRARDDSGFALLFVLFVTTIVMIGTATMLTVTAGQIVPAKRSQDSLTANQAAQSGIQDFLANLNAHCRTNTIQACSWLQTASVTGSTVASDGSTLQSWTVTPQNTSDAQYIANNADTVRITSVGRAGTAAHPLATRTLTADISGQLSVLRYTYFTNYETVGKSFLDSYFPQRTITISSAAAANALGVPVGSTVKWQGTASAPANTDPNNYSAGYSDDICDRLYYDSGSTVGRATMLSTRTKLPAGTDYAEDGILTTPLGATTKYVRYGTCAAVFSKGMNFTGPVYTRDAASITNGEFGAATGPSFTVPDAEDLPAVTTGWTATATPAASSTKPYLVDQALGGVPTTASTSTAQLIQSSPVAPLSLPSSANPTATCTYTGPTRIRLDGTQAIVWSPQTAATGGACYTSNSSGNGVNQASVPIDDTTIRVVDSTSSTTTTPSFPGLSLGASGDITTYSPTKGDAYVNGSLTSGRLSIVASNDIVVTGDINNPSAKTTTNAYGETSWKSGGAVDLVATDNVRVYHPVSCVSGSATNGYCPNDITGLFSSAQTGLVDNLDGTLKSTHPSLQYCNVAGGNCQGGGNVTINATIFALNGSFYTDNFNRGTGVGDLTVNGGIYENHRGPLGQLWQIPTASINGSRPYSGYKLQLNYVSYEAAGLPYVPVLSGTNLLNPWHLIDVSAGGS